MWKSLMNPFGAVLLGLGLSVFSSCASSSVPALTTTLSGEQMLRVCPVFQSRLRVVTLINRLDEKVMENGLVAEVWDLTSDGKIDAVTYSIPGSHEPPLFYELDVDSDNMPDLLYIDAVRNGQCDSIKVYNDYRKPGKHHPTPQEMPQWLVDGL